VLVMGTWGSVVLGGVALIESGHRVANPWRDLARPFEQQASHDGMCRHYYVESARLAAAIQEVTRPEDRIFIWSNHPLPYFLSDRLMAGPYSSLFLVTAPWLGERGVERLVHRLEQERPKLIVLGANDALWVPADSRELLRAHPLMREFIDEHYRRVRGYGTCQFWIRSD
jgi:hypothetical protein